MGRLALCCLAFSVVMFAAKKERNWQTGKVADSVTSMSEVAKAAAAGPRHGTADAHIVTIQGGGNTYTARENNAWHGWCLLIVGDQIKYAQGKGNLYVLDASGNQCKLDIVREEKRE